MIYVAHGVVVRAVTITLTPRYIRSGDYTGTRIDLARCTWKGRTLETASRHGASMVLARQLVAAGCPDQPYEARDADGRLLFFGPSLYRLARLTIREADTIGPRIVPFIQDARFSHSVRTQDGFPTPAGILCQPLTPTPS